MFNYDARQIFVVQPRNTGGGITSILLTLDTQTANVGLKNISKAEKIQAWQNFTAQTPITAHVYGFNNFGHERHLQNLASADSSTRYVHKHHFYELDYLNNNKKHALLDQMSDKQAVGIYLTEECVDKLYKIRPNTVPVDFYQRWIYSNQRMLLPTFFGIKCKHVWSFSEMLDTDKFLDHIMYCKELFDLDTDPDLYARVIRDWHTIIKGPMS